MSLQGFTGELFGKPRPGSLSTIIRSFKSAVTKHIHEQDMYRRKSLWQLRFHDHVIRDDIDNFFVEQYIDLNPIMWELDADNPVARRMSIEEFGKTLRKEHGLNGFALERVIEYELGYRQWSSRSKAGE